jgi:hypothetical protein
VVKFACKWNESDTFLLSWELEINSRWTVVTYNRVLHHLNPFRMDSLRICTPSMHDLLEVSIVPLHEIYDDESLSLLTSMHSWRIDIPLSQEP